VFFFHHYELPAILQQARIQQIILETQSQQGNENNRSDRTDGSGGDGSGGTDEADQGGNGGNSANNQNYQTDSTGYYYTFFSLKIIKIDLFKKMYFKII